MDQFGVFTESYGLKPQGKSAPMAATKRQASSNGGVNSGYSSTSSWNSSSPNGGFGSDQKSPNYGGDGYDDLFGAFSKPSDDRTSKSASSFDYDSIFGGSNQSVAKSSPLSGYDNNDIFGGVLGMNSSASSRKVDVFASFSSPPSQNTGFDDLLGNFGGGMEAQSKSSGRNGSAGDGLYDWVDGFGRSSPSKNRVNMQTSQPRQATKTTFMKSEDPFIVLESTSNSAYSSELFSNPPRNAGNTNFSGGTKLSGSSNPSPILRPPPKPLQVVKPDKSAASFSEQKKTTGSSISAIDELQDFAMGRAGNNYNEEKLRNSAVSKKEINGSTGIKERQNAKASRFKVDDATTQEHKGEDDLESFFSMTTRSRSVPKSRAATLVQNRRQPEVAQRTSSGSSSSSMKKASSATNLVDDLSSVFGASPIFGEFEEVEGESEERRRARLGRLQRTQERAAKALADMNQRDLQTQREQDEKYRIGEAVDFEIKRWAAGKENNMRALLSSLHYVLWPECGWQPVSLTDMITSTSVKKVYRKATLCIHPDKVQQKGATLPQKYTAEKVFDILKEAYNKFNKEELS